MCFSAGCGIWHSQVRYGDSGHVCDEAGAHHEVSYSSRYGRYYSHLRSSRRGVDSQRYQAIARLFTVQVSVYIYRVFQIKGVRSSYNLHLSGQLGVLLRA